MGKEAKIGLAVILILVITFGVVLVRRLSGSGDTSETAAANEQTAETPETPRDSTEDGGKKPSMAAPTKPMVLTAGAASSTPPRSPGDVSHAGDDLKGGAPPRLASPSAAKPFPVMSVPEIGEAASVAPSESYANDTQSAGSNLPPAKPDNTTTWDPAGVDSASDTSQANAARLIPPGTATTDQQSPSIRVVASPQESLQPPALPAYEPPSATGPSPGVASAAKAPTFTQSSRVPYTTAPPAIPARPVANSGTDVALRPTFNSYDSPGAGGEYKVQPNDSYWVISERLYGTGNYFKALAEHNRKRIPLANQLAVGDVISVPSVAELERDYPGLCPKPGRLEALRNRTSNISAVSTYVGGRTYVVQEGDTLADIARHELGKLSRWPEIYELNRGVLGEDPDFLSPGIELVLPDDNAPSPTYTAQPDTGTIYRR